MEHEEKTVEEFVARLRHAGLSVTRPRLALARLLFSGDYRHVSAAGLQAEAAAADIDVAPATIYNFLNTLTSAGMLRQVGVEGGRTYFDTDTSNHNHFFVEDEQRLIDMPRATLRVDGLPPVPDGMMIAHVDVVVRLVRRSQDQGPSQHN